MKRGGHQRHSALLLALSSHRCSWTVRFGALTAVLLVHPGLLSLVLRRGHVIPSLHVLKSHVSGIRRTPLMCHLAWTMWGW